jgi:hypothetical protein
MPAGRRVPCGKAHGSWSYKVDLPSDDGRRRQLGKDGFATKRDAEQAMAQLLAKAARGPVVRVSAQGIGDYLTDWLQVIRPTLSPAAWTDYRTCVDRYVRPRLSTVRLGQMSGATLSRHYAMLLERGGHQGRPLSPPTVRTVHRVLSKALASIHRGSSSLGVAENENALTWQQDRVCLGPDHVHTEGHLVDATVPHPPGDGGELR